MTLLLTIIVGECGLRLARVQFPDRYRHDARRGWALREGSEGWARAEGQSYVKISSAGLRDREHAVAKPADTIRIAVLGDSYAEAVQVPAEKAFWAEMERDLRSCPRLLGNDIEVLNFGVSSYGTAHELLTLQEVVWPYSPDLVLTAFLTGNDFADNSDILAHVTYGPFFHLREGRLELDLSRNTHPAYKRAWRWLLRVSRIAQVLQAARASRDAERSKHTADNDGEIGLYDQVYLPPKTTAWRAAWEVTEALLLAMHDEVTSHGAELFMVTLSNGIQVNPDAALRERYAHRIGSEDLFYPDLTIASFARSHGIETYTLAPELRRRAEQQRTCVHGFSNAIPCEGHWNEEGHRVAGQMMAKALCEGPLLRRQAP
jgi:hypothetical protein